MQSIELQNNPYLNTNTAAYLFANEWSAWTCAIPRPMCALTNHVCMYVLWLRTGGDLRGLEDGPPKIWGGGRPRHLFPNISRSTVGCEANYELTKKWSQGGIFCSELEVFGQEKGHMHVCYIPDFIQYRQAKDRQNRVDDCILGVKMEIVFLKKVIQNFGPQIFFHHSQTRHQVSAHVAARMCVAFIYIYTGM